MLSTNLKKCIGSVICGLALVLFPQVSAADTIVFDAAAPGSEAVGGFAPRIIPSGETAFDYSLDFRLDTSPLTVEFDEAAGTARVTANSTGDILASDRTTVVGTSTGVLDILFSGLQFNQVINGETVYAVGFQSQYASSTGGFDISLDFNSIDVPDQNVNLDVTGNFVDIPNVGTRTLERFGYLGEPFNFIFADVNGVDELHAWIVSTGDFKLDGLGAFRLHGDIHAATGTGTAEVPEPSTVVLLGAGVLGLAFRKRKLANG